MFSPILFLPFFFLISFKILFSALDKDEDGFLYIAYAAEEIWGK